MQIQKIDNTNFKMAMVCKPNYHELSCYMFNKLSYKQYLKFENLLISQRDNPMDIYVSVINENNKKKVIAEVGSKVYKENFFNSGLSVIKKAVKYADKLHAEKIKTDEMLKGFNKPVLD